jgi:ubiquinone biosynthesis protein UbiJ
MSAKSHENLKAIRFEGELLPNWAQLLDLAARLCPLSEDVRRWFSRLTGCSGVDDARTVTNQCKLLQASIQEHRDAIAEELKRSRDDAQASQVIGAWMYALDTMIQVARTTKACSWIVEGAEETEPDDSDGGDITLRPV